MTLIERCLGDSAVFYDLVRNELHDLKGVDVTTEEFSENSSFDFKNEGDDGDPDDDSTNPHIHTWHECDLTMDDDSLYWKAKSGKTAGLLIYSIVKAEAKAGKISLWLAPTDSSDEFGIVTFWKFGRG